MSRPQPLGKDDILGQPSNDSATIRQKNGQLKTVTQSFILHFCQPSINSPRHAGSALRANVVGEISGLPISH